jgi:hypothetical protein
VVAGSVALAHVDTLKAAVENHGKFTLYKIFIL